MERVAVGNSSSSASCPPTTSPPPPAFARLRIDPGIGAAASPAAANGDATANGQAVAVAPVTAAAPAAVGDGDGLGLLSIAPMMEWTDRNYRYMMRLLTRRTQLWTEMVVADTLLHAAAPLSFIRFSPEERPVVCQLGGSDPAKLARAAALVERMGYDAINLNCGCPSNRVAGKGAFGARLMFTPELVRDCVAAMRAAVAIPVTVKCRLGADDVDSYEAFARFVAVVAEGGCTEFVVHARKCLLRGLNPKENRSVPPLRYDWVQRAALQFPHLRISLNGGVSGLAHAKQLLALRRRRRADAGDALPLSRSPGDAPTTAPVAAAHCALAVAASASCDEGTSSRGGAPAASLDAAAAPAAAVGGGDGDGSAGSGCCDSSGVAEACAPESNEGVAAGTLACGHVAATAVEPLLDAGAAPTAEAASSWAWLPAAPAFPIEPGCVMDASALAAEAPVPPSSDVAGGGGGDDGSGGDASAPSAGGRVLHSVMLGRVAYSDPWLFADADRAVFGVPNPGLSRREVVAAYLDYCDAVVATLPPEERGLVTYRPGEMMKPLMGLFHGCRGSTRFRSALATTVGAGRAALREGVLAALEAVDPVALDARSP